MTRREYWRTVIFEHETRAGTLFDIVLIGAILGSVLTIVIDSVQGLPPRVHSVLFVLEWSFTLLFTVEYLARLWCAEDRKKYATGFFGVVDLLAVLPSWLALAFPSVRFLEMVRILRVLRIFNILNLTSYAAEATLLMQALVHARRKIVVFIFTIVTAVSVVGSLMYFIEGPEHGFTSIPTAMYWAVVTMTTVGYGDISPATTVGRFLASALMILGYGIIAVPTGILTLEFQKASQATRERHVARCKECGQELPQKS